MARKNRTPEENARREKIRELLQMANIGSTHHQVHCVEFELLRVPLPFAFGHLSLLFVIYCVVQKHYTTFLTLRMT